MSGLLLQTSFMEVNFIFQQDLATPHIAKNLSTWFQDHSIYVLANTPDLKPTENLWAIVKKMQNTRLNILDLLDAIRAPWASSYLGSAAVIHANEAPSKYLVLDMFILLC